MSGEFVNNVVQSCHISDSWLNVREGDYSVRCVRCTIEKELPYRILIRYNFHLLSLLFLLLLIMCIWKQDPEANVWTQEEWEWGVEKAAQWGT